MSISILNERFMALMGRFMPNWRNRKDLLNSLPEWPEKWEYGIRDMSFRLLFLPFAVLLIGGCEKENKRSTSYVRTPPVEVFEEDPDGNVEVFLNSPIEADGPSSESQSPIGQALLLLIEEAEQTLDIAAYGVREQPEILAALARAEQRGVLVRVVYDQDIHGESYYPDTPLLAEIGQSRSDLEADLYAARIVKAYEDRSFWPAPKGFKGPPQCVGYTIAEGRAVIAVHASREPIEFVGDIMHNKFVVADGKKVWTGSCNLSNSGTGGYNANAAVVIQSEPVAAWYTEEFERMFTNGLFHRRKTDEFRPHRRELSVEGRTLLQLGFCPQDYCFNNIVEPALRGASESIDVAIFFLTHKQATGELIKAHRRGVKVRVIVDATSAKNGYTKHELLRAAGIPVKVESWGGEMHMKCALIDGEKMVLGSMNWTAAGESKNDENVILLDHPKSAAEFGSLFEEMWESIPDRWLGGQPDPESKDSVGSDSDGIDNDFDGLVDGKDPGCGPSPPPLPSLPPYKVVPLADGHQLIKGNISSKGERIFHVPGSKYYDRTSISEQDGERWFPSVIEAKEAGWRGSRSR